MWEGGGGQAAPVGGLSDSAGPAARRLMACHAGHEPHDIHADQLGQLVGSTGAGKTAQDALPRLSAGRTRKLAWVARD